MKQQSSGSQGNPLQKFFSTLGELLENHKLVILKRRQLRDSSIRRLFPNYSPQGSSPPPLSAASSREDYSPKCVCQARKDIGGGVSCDVVRIDVLYSVQHGHAFGEKVWWKNLGKRGGDRVEIGIVQLGTAAGSLVVPWEERTLLV